jgi:hypothetical protein
VLLGQLQGGVAPAQRVGGGLRLGVGEHRQHVRLAVPEGVPVVAGPGQPLGGQAAALGSGAGLEDVEQREPDRLLQLRVALDPHVGAVPELVQVGPLLGEQLPQAGVAGAGQRGGDLVTKRRRGPQAGPPVGEQFHEAQPLPRLEGAHQRGPRPVLGRRAVHAGLARRLDEVVHAGRQLQPAAPGAVQQHRAAGMEILVQGDQRVLQYGRLPRVSGVWRGRLVGHQLRLHDHPDCLVDRVDHVLDRGDRPLGERHQPPRSHSDPAAGGRFPVSVTGQRSGAQVQHPLVAQQPPVADVERLVVDQQPDQLAVGDIDDCLAGLREAVAGLGPRQGPHLVEGVEVGARDGVRLPLVQVPAQPDVAVGQRNSDSDRASRSRSSLRSRRHQGSTGNTSFSPSSITGWPPHAHRPATRPGR